MISRIIEAAQLEVLNEDLPNVITDALEEQVKWNQFCRQRSSRPKSTPCASSDPEDVDPFVFKPAEGTLGPFVSLVAAAGRAGAKGRLIRFLPFPIYGDILVVIDLGKKVST